MCRAHSVLGWGWRCPLKEPGREMLRESPVCGFIPGAPHRGNAEALGEEEGQAWAVREEQSILMGRSM